MDAYEDAKEVGYGDRRVRAIFDDVVEDTRLVLKDFTHDFRTEKQDVRSDKVKFCDGCGLIKLKCKCPESDEEV